ncbi:MAG: AraC family transcriptional regulator [Parachlamydiaceae bacterium]|nr:AraC family transcriptional regulator [Parachlamydiaceae bacterium]
MFEIKIIPTIDESSEYSEVIGIEYLVSNENFIAVKSLKRLSTENQNQICQHIRSKKIVLSHTINKECYYIFISFAMISNVLKKPGSKIKLDKIIEQNLLNNTVLVKLLDIEMDFYSTLDPSLNVNNSANLALVHQCVLVVLRNIQKVAGEIKSNLNHVTVQELHKLEEWVFSNSHLPTPTIDELAGKLNMSASKFKLVFNEVYACSPHQYFLNIKLKKACNTLHFTELSVSEVSFKYGFTHPSGFSRFIKTKLGVSPLEFNTKIKY